MKEVNKEIKLEVTYPKEGTISLWAVIPSDVPGEDKWLKIQDYLFVNEFEKIIPAIPIGS